MKRVKRRTRCQIPCVLVSLFVFIERVDVASLSSSKPPIEEERSRDSHAFTRADQADDHTVERHLAEMAVIHSSVDYLGVYDICSSMKTYIEDNTMIILREKQSMQRYKCKQYFEVKNPNSQLNLNCQLLNLHRSCIKESLTIYVDGAKKSIICSKKSYPKVWMGKQIFLHYVRRFFRDSQGYLCSMVALESNGNGANVNAPKVQPENPSLNKLNSKKITTTSIPTFNKAGLPTSLSSDMGSSNTSNSIPTPLELSIGDSYNSILNATELSSSYTPLLHTDFSFRTSGSISNETTATSTTEALQPEMLSEVYSHLISDTTNTTNSSDQRLSTEPLSETSIESISYTSDRISFTPPTFFVDSAFKTDVISSSSITGDNFTLSPASTDLSTNSTDLISTAEGNLSMVQIPSEISWDSASTTPEVISFTSALLDFTINATVMTGTNEVNVSTFSTSLNETSLELSPDLMLNTSEIATSTLPPKLSINYSFTPNITNLISSTNIASLSTVQKATTEISKTSFDSKDDFFYFPTSSSFTDPSSNTSDLFSPTTEVSLASTQTVLTNFTSEASSLLGSNVTEDVPPTTNFPMESSISTSESVTSTTRTTLSSVPSFSSELTFNESLHSQPSTLVIGSSPTHSTQTSTGFDFESNSTTADLSTLDALIVSNTTDSNSFITHAISYTVASTTENTSEGPTTGILPSISAKWSNTTETDKSILQELINSTFYYGNVTESISSETFSQESSSKLYSIAYSTVNYRFGSVTPSTSHIGTVTNPQFKLCDKCGTSAFLKGQAHKSENMVKKSFPWMVFVLVETDSFTGNCGGVLISPRTVVTAAHCLDYDIHLIFLGFGMTNLLGEEEEGFWQPADGYKLFDGYDQDTLEGDIAIITLANDIQFNDFVRPICLFESYLRPEIGASVTVLGWSITSSPDASLTHTLQEVNLTIWSSSQCSSVWSSLGFPIFNEQICVAERGHKPCLGDSGGPAMIMVKERWFLIGVVSYGFHCSDQRLPGVNTGITNYLDWINENTTNTTCSTNLQNDFIVALNDSFNYDLPQDRYK